MRIQYSGSLRRHDGSEADVRASGSATRVRSLRARRDSVVEVGDAEPGAAARLRHAGLRSFSSSRNSMRVRAWSRNAPSIALVIV